MNGHSILTNNSNNHTMRKLFVILSLICALYASELAHSQNTWNDPYSNRPIRKPAETSSNAGTINVDRTISTAAHTWTLKSIELTPSKTVCHWSVTPKQRDTYIQMTKGVCLIDNNGNRYPMASCEGISMAPNKDFIYNIRTVEFSVTFPAISSSATSLTYFSSSSFMVENIKLTGRNESSDYAYNNAVIKLINKNMEKPTFRSTMEPLMETYKQMHTQIRIEGESEYMSKKGMYRSKFIDYCVNKYFNEQFPYDYAMLIAPYMKGHVGIRDIETVVEYLNDNELFNAISRLEAIGNCLGFLDESFWEDAANKILEGKTPNIIQEKYCSSNYTALFDDYYVISNTNELIEAMIDGQMMATIPNPNEAQLEFIRSYKSYMLATLRTVCLNYCIDASISERELQICVNFNSTQEYQTLANGMVAAMQSMYSNTEQLSEQMWSGYSKWVSRGMCNNTL